MTNILAFNGKLRNSLSFCEIRGLVIFVTMMFVLPISVFSQTTPWTIEGTSINYPIKDHYLGTSNYMLVIFKSNS
jgi:hypothetical protein